MRNLFLVLILGLAACGQTKPDAQVIGKDSKAKLVSQAQAVDIVPADSAEAATAEPVPVPGPAPQLPIPIPAAMVGTWVKPCTAMAGDEDEKTGYSEVEEMTIGANGELTIVRTYYEGGKCKYNKKVQSARIEGSITLTADLIKSNENIKSFVTYFDSDAIEQANLFKTCGLADWQWGVEHVDCLSQQGQNALDAQYSLNEKEGELAVFSCDSDNLDECESQVFYPKN